MRRMMISMEEHVDVGQSEWGLNALTRISGYCWRTCNYDNASVLFVQPVASRSSGGAGQQMK